MVDEQAPPTGVESPHLVAVLGVKGGVGATMVAVGTAAGTLPEMDPCVIDLDLYKGDVAGVLDLEVDQPLATVADRLLDLDADGLRGSAARHPDGLWVLGQPESLADSGAPSADELHALLVLAREAWQPVVVDCGSRVDAQTVQTARDADTVLLVCTPDVVAVRDLLRVRRLLVGLGVPRDRLHLVINHTEPTADMSPSEIEDVAEQEILGAVRYDPSTVRVAAHDGVPVPDAAARSTVARDLAHIWTALGGVGPTTVEESSWWRRLCQRR